MQRWRTRHDIRGICSQTEGGGYSGPTSVFVPSFSGGGPTANSGPSFGLIGSIPISAFNPSATADQYYSPTTTQGGNQTSPFDIAVNFSQLAGPGNSANASLFGGGGGGGGGGGSNYANFDPTITQVYAPPNYSMPLAALLGNMGSGSQPFEPMMGTQADPNTFRALPAMNMPLQGGVGMNAPAVSAPSPLPLMFGGNLAPNASASPLMPQQGTPTAQASPFSQFVPPMALPGAMNNSPVMSPMAPPMIGGSAMMPSAQQQPQYVQGFNTAAADAPAYANAGQPSPQTGEVAGASLPNMLNALPGSSPLSLSQQTQQQKQQQQENPQPRGLRAATQAMSPAAAQQFETNQILGQAADAISQMNRTLDQIANNKQAKLNNLAADRAATNEALKEKLDRVYYPTHASQPQKPHPFLNALRGAVSGAAYAMDPQAQSARDTASYRRANLQLNQQNAQSLDEYRASQSQEKALTDIAHTLNTRYEGDERAINNEANNQTQEALSQTSRTLTQLHDGVIGQNDIAARALEEMHTKIETDRLTMQQRNIDSEIAARAQNAAAHTVAANASAQNAGTNASRFAAEKAAGYYPAEAMSKLHYAGFTPNGAPIRPKTMDFPTFQGQLYRDYKNGQLTREQFNQASMLGRYAPGE